MRAAAASGASAEQTHHRRPPWATQVALGHYRAEHEERSAGEIADAEEDDRRPNPRLPSKLVPALAQLAQERLRFHLVGTRIDRDPNEERGGNTEARRVEQDRRARAAESHE